MFSRCSFEAAKTDSINFIWGPLNAAFLRRDSFPTEITFSEVSPDSAPTYSSVINKKTFFNTKRFRWKLCEVFF